MRWADYEALAFRIFDELMPYADVKIDDHLNGAQTEGPRQIDVSARWSTDDHEYVLIVQVKDYKSRADVNVVGEFKSVIEDVEASKGVLICSGGFSKRAIVYARNVGIELYSLHDANSKHWNEELTIPIIWANLVPNASLSFRFETGHDSGRMPLDAKTGFPPVSEDEGRTTLDLRCAFTRAWEAGVIDRTPGGPRIERLPGSYQLLMKAHTGADIWLPIRELEATYSVEAEFYLGHLKPSEARGLINFHADGMFIPSFVRIDDIPTSRKEDWPRISDAERVALSGTKLAVTTESYGIKLADGFHHFTVREVGLNPSLDDV